MSAFNNSKPPSDQETQWHPMGGSFTTSSSGQPSAPPEQRETWAQRMSRREHRRRDPSATRATSFLRLAPGPRDLKRAHRDHKKQRAGEQEEVDQLTAFRTGAFDGLDSRNGSTP